MGKGKLNFNFEDSLNEYFLPTQSVQPLQYTFSNNMWIQLSDYRRSGKRKQADAILEKLRRSEVKFSTLLKVLNYREV